MPDPDLRKMGPLAADHPAVAGSHNNPPKECPACHASFQAGDYVTLVTLGPGASHEEQRKAARGAAYTAVAAVVHWTCATGEQP